ncbi:cohesin domain-containing protein [Paenibacillus agaridevorans]|uniref:cohesin domain-containing protein n=1 Tax=Paenibacillus agaridevorans TaxID=171404 RepID=UPI001BE41689|nr:cohesin domain-containing protein [Paenibacillus agaridevorans]
MKTYAKRTLATLLAAVIVMPAPFASASESTGQNPTPLSTLNAELTPSPIFNWTFEQNLVNDKVVANSVNSQVAAGNAELKGTASVINDSKRGQVLSLPGGSNGTSWLKLPDHMYQEVQNELTIALWANIETSASNFARLFSSTITGMGLTNSGVNGWQDPEFVLINGGGTFNNRVYTGTNTSAIASYKGDIAWGTQPARGKWQHIAVTMKSDGSYQAYLDGQSVSNQLVGGFNTTSGATMASVLERLFDRNYLDALQFNAFGRSLYSSDGDNRGKFDDLQVYNVKLTAEQVNGLYEATKHDDNAAATPAQISVNLADRSLGQIYHGAAGALYAISEPNVPDINTLIPIKPSHISQKPPNGIQHPTGDALRVADYFFEAGGEVVNIVMQDYYQHWYYPSRTAEQYINEAIIPIVTAVKSFKDRWALDNPGKNPDEKFIYIPYNEPEQDNTRYPQLLADSQTGRNSRAVFNSDWLAITNKIKELDPGAHISGPNLTQYGARVFQDFVPYCVENDCLPDIISWHMLWNQAFNAAAGAVGTFRSVEAQSAQRYSELYPDRESPFPIQVDVNEYAQTTETAVGGSLVQYIARYDELKMTSMLPYWNTANSYGSLLAGQNEPNGAWWLYKWYADMIGGDMAKVTVNQSKYENDQYGPGLYGLSSIQDQKKQVGIAFGGTQGQGQVVFNNVTGNANSPDFLKNAEQVHVTVWHAGYTGLTGFLVEPTQIIDRNLPVVNGSVTLNVKMDDYTSAYYAVITPAVDSQPHEVWSNRYEAENAQVKTNVITTSLYPRNANSGRSASNGQIIEGIKHADSAVKWTNITVPKDGNYRLDLIGGSGSTASMRNQANTGNSNQRINSEWFIKVDNQPAFKIVLRADYNMQLLGGSSTYIDLTQGTHSISVSKFNPDTSAEGQGEASLDAIELTYSGETGTNTSYVVQAEFAEYDNDKGLSRGSSLAGFEGAGYVTGYGQHANANTRFVVSVMEDGMYDVTLRHASGNDGAIVLDHDRKHVKDIAVTNTNGQWKDATVRMFLRTGINLIDVKSTASLSLDYVHAVFADNSPLFSIEAEDAVVVGTPAGAELPLIRNDAFAKYASGGKYVSGITSYDSAERYLEIQDIVVPKDGIYKMVVKYANGESSGTHAYNNDIVERYAQISINGAAPQTVYFKNTISWQQFATQTLDVELKAGTNSIRFSNNNTYNGGSNDLGGSTFPFKSFTHVPNQYTPAFDRFDFYAQTQIEEAPEGAVLSGSEAVLAGQTVDLLYGLNTVHQDVFAQDVTLAYDPAKLEFVSVKSKDEDKFLVVATKLDEVNGTVRFLGVHLGAARTNPNVTLADVQFKSKLDAATGLTTIPITRAILADGLGAETTIGGNTHTVQIAAVDRSTLQSAIAAAEALYASATEGPRIGQYPIGSKAVLQAAIQAARDVYGNSNATAGEIQTAVGALNNATQLFSSSIVTHVDGDATGNDQLSVGDLAVVSKAYGMTDKDAGWNAVNVHDRNNDGKIDIEDLVWLALRIFNW